MFSKAPLLLCVDLQNEFLAEGRPHSISDAKKIIANCQDVLIGWRRKMWPVVHLKRIAKAAYFNPASNLTDWVNDAKPLPAEMTFEHPLPSAYSSVKFSEYMANIDKLRCVVIGFSLEVSIIATVIEGFHRGDRFELLHEAIGGNHELKPALINTIKSFCKVTDVSAIEEFSS
jgi:nicotinamidase-related amidase